MKFKFGQVVKINDEFYGEIQGVITGYKHDYEVCGMSAKTGKLAHIEDCHEYLVLFHKEGLNKEEWFMEKEIKLAGEKQDE